MNNRVFADVSGELWEATWTVVNGKMVLSDLFSEDADEPADRDTLEAVLEQEAWTQYQPDPTHDANGRRYGLNDNEEAER